MFENDATKQTVQEQTIQSAETTNVEIPEELPPKPAILVRVGHKNLEAEVQFQKTHSESPEPLFEDVMAALAEQNVVYGINETTIRHLCENPVYNRNYVIARGETAQTGEDGRLEFKVETDRRLRPKQREDGTVDFKDIGYIETVEKDQLLCIIHPPKRGAPGKDVYGNELEGFLGREAKNPGSTNTYLSEDGTQLFASCNGNVEFKKGTLSINDVLRIPGNVDNATGNISFPGDIMVAGDVVSGFEVKAQGSIAVRGNVEGAILEAGGDITIAQNMNGMNRGTLRAGGSVKCRHLQSAFVYADSDIYAETLMYCSVECGGDVELSGKRGALIGGKASIAGRLQARTIGTSTHVATEVNMCVTGVNANKKIQDLNGQIKHMDGEITKLIQILTRFEELGKKMNLSNEQLATVAQVRQSYQILSQQRKSLQADLEEIKRQQLEADQQNSYIECKERVHTGTRISFGPVQLLVRESFVYSRIHIIGGSIQISPL